MCVFTLILALSNFHTPVTKTAHMNLTPKYHSVYLFNVKAFMIIYISREYIEFISGGDNVYNIQIVLMKYRKSVRNVYTSTLDKL